MSTAALTSRRPAPADAAGPAVEIQGLHKHFGAVRAVDGLDLTVSRGEVLAFLGPNGAGKSTALDVVLGFTAPTAGSVTVLGSSPAQAVATDRVGAVLQTGGLIEAYTVRQTLEVVASLQAREPDVADVVAQTDLAGLLGRRVSRLSGGERQRVRLALALLPDPELLVLDEPTTGLDVTARTAFWETMRAQTSQAGRTIVFATHYLQEAADFADRIVIINNGRLLADGSIDELRAGQRATTVTATWPGLTGREEVLTALGPCADSLVGLVVHGEHVELRTTASDDLARLLLTSTPAVHLGIEAPDLDEIFSELVGSDAGSGTEHAS
ncbi:ABC transporter ATP-binding protein [Actinomyces howellii]|uniref:Daunorubicin/doxorubicin resistance ATP-binding protein DrrA n=1 Tax=Actinomyces howellii TaxID=52771 RepID=A0A3S4SM41_9ACTO|nr:ABC transporter ATP-binding protein [Actinomyces howellii]VEG26958.1 Daunorubicin/doxorubicin resistance ATP-binding protein DrrA [Actinomyces howellii]